MLVLHNSERLINNKFGSEYLVKEALIKDLQFNPRNPSWVTLDQQIQRLSDETEYF